MFVSLAQLYPQIAMPALTQGAAVLRNATSVAWHVNETSAVGVAYLFGVYRGSVVSAYRVLHPVQHWPVIPRGAIGEGRRCVPVVAVEEQEWTHALGWNDIRMVGPVRYGEITTDAAGKLDEVAFPERPPYEDEQPESGVEGAQ
jgi:hypothetical protein